MKYYIDISPLRSERIPCKEADSLVLVNINPGLCQHAVIAEVYAEEIAAASEIVRRA